MQTIVECVPNFSEGQDAKKVEAIIAALLAGPEVYLLDREMDADHNRSVITVVGTRERIGEAALRGIGKAAELIDLTKHQGAHPRLGATDVVPFVPVSGVALDDCVRIAAWVAEQAWQRFKIPTYLYEAAARKPERKNLENIRRGQFEGLRDEVRTNPERLPDFGEAALHPTAGATVVGARKFLIAYNINLDTAEVGLAKTIAKKIRASSGGFPCVKAMGVELKARNQAQVSMNLTDFETTPIGVVFDAVAREAAAEGVSVVGSEIVGLVPRRALEDAAVHYLKVENYRPELIIENRLAKVLEEQAARTAVAGANLCALAEGFVRAVAAPTATPGGGSVAALAGALAAALGEMVCGLTLKRKSLEAHYPKLEAHRSQLAALRARFLANVDRDAQSYDSVMAARRLPKATEAERAARDHAIEEASKLAATVPLESVEFVAEVEQVLRDLQPITIPQAASDLSVALALAEAARAGALENVHANLPSIQDRAWVERIADRLGRLENPRSGPPETSGT
ncbi:MAG: glutamate formimidoyltransferase [Acidobacteriia bacterium]|nr:glutamate formimidoyltransferase [Terriglobia bacterium]